jgi:hypothetical protein
MAKSRILTQRTKADIVRADDDKNAINLGYKYYQNTKGV